MYGLSAIHWDTQLILEVSEEENKRRGYTLARTLALEALALEVRPVTRAEARPVTRAEARPETRAETHPEARAEARPETRVEVGGDNHNAHVAECQTPDGDALV